MIYITRNDGVTTWLYVQLFFSISTYFKRGFYLTNIFFQRKKPDSDITKKLYTTVLSSSKNLKFIKIYMEVHADVDGDDDGKKKRRKRC